jgi:hypothetical protein
MIAITIIFIIIVIYICYNLNNNSNYERKYVSVDIKINNQICILCDTWLDDYECVYIRKSCGHIFHENCLIKYFKNKKLYEPICIACKKI